MVFGNFSNFCTVKQKNLKVEISRCQLDLSKGEHARESKILKEIIRHIPGFVTYAYHTYVLLAAVCSALCSLCCLLCQMPPIPHLNYIILSFQLRIV